ncbi:MAG: hypothetical protein FWF92_07675 [Oscillospiraceae bacterium]|nr:hypothetical protein [Oscillospiraceae bacterium]
METIKLHIDTVRYNSKPNESAAIIKNRLQKETAPIEIKIVDLFDKINDGYTISPGVMSGGAKSENWTEQQVFLIDIDNNNIDIPLLNIDEAIKICEKNNIPLTFYYYSFSHIPEHPKYRLCFILDEVITEYQKRTAILQSLMSLFDQADKSCRDGSRYFYGTNKGGEIINLNDYANYENIISAFIPLEKDQITDSLSAHTENDYKVNIEDDELDRLKRDFDLFGYIHNRNGEYKNISGGAMFKNCEICGHNDDLVYYKNTNSFFKENFGRK